MKNETSTGCSAEVRVKSWVFLAVLSAFFFSFLFFPFLLSVLF